MEPTLHALDLLEEYVTTVRLVHPIFVWDLTWFTDKSAAKSNMYTYRLTTQTHCVRPKPNCNSRSISGSNRMIWLMSLIMINPRPRPTPVVNQSFISHKDKWKTKSFKMFFRNLSILSIVRVHLLLWLHLKRKSSLSLLMKFFKQPKRAWTLVLSLTPTFSAFSSIFKVFVFNFA